MQNSDLKQSQDPHLPDLKAAEGRSRQQHTDLVQRLVPVRAPAHVHTHTRTHARRQTDRVMVHLHAASNSVNSSR